MALHKTCTRNLRGFSLIELLVVLAVFAIIASMSTLMTLGDYRSHSLREERESLVAQLQKAREEAMHGTCLGDACSGPVSQTVHTEQVTVVFEALSGRASGAPGNTLTVSDTSGHSSIITVGAEGRISWTN